MALLDITGFAPTNYRTAGMIRYCPVTEQVLSGYIRHGVIADDPSERGQELQNFLRIYLEAGREPSALGMRAPFVFWLVTCGWTTPQEVLAVMAGESAGQVQEDDLVRLFSDRWILEAFIENWPTAAGHAQAAVWGGGLALGGPQREYQLSHAIEGVTRAKLVRMPNHRGGLTTSLSPYVIDEFTAYATDWSQRNLHIDRAAFAQLTNEPALPALLARPQILRLEPESGFSGPGELVVVSQRWRELVKHTFAALVTKRAGPVTARLVFEGISKGLDWFRLERKR